MAHEDSGKYFVRYHSLRTDINRIQVREILEDDINEIASNENAILISTNLLVKVNPTLMVSVWMWK